MTSVTFSFIQDPCEICIQVPSPEVWKKGQAASISINGHLKKYFASNSCMFFKFD